MFTYQMLDELLGSKADAIHRDKDLGRLHDELASKVLVAQKWFERQNAGNTNLLFGKEPVCPSIKRRLENIMSILNARTKKLPPNQ